MHTATEPPTEPAKVQTTSRRACACQSWHPMGRPQCCRRASCALPRARARGACQRLCVCRTCNRTCTRRIWQPRARAAVVMAAPRKTRRPVLVLPSPSSSPPPCQLRRCCCPAAHSWRRAVPPPPYQLRRCWCPAAHSWHRAAPAPAPQPRHENLTQTAMCAELLHVNRSPSSSTQRTILPTRSWTRRLRGRVW